MPLEVLVNVQIDKIVGEAFIWRSQAIAYSMVLSQRVSKDRFDGKPENRTDAQASIGLCSA